MRNIADIAALPGVDMIAIGTNDLSAELGVPGDFKHPLVRAAHENAIAACKLAGKPLGKRDPGVYLVEAVNGDLRAFGILIVSDLATVEKTADFAAACARQQSGADRECRRRH